MAASKISDAELAPLVAEAFARGDTIAQIKSALRVHPRRVKRVLKDLGCLPSPQEMRLRASAKMREWRALPEVRQRYSEAAKRQGFGDVVRPEPAHTAWWRPLLQIDEQDAHLLLAYHIRVHENARGYCRVLCFCPRTQKQYGLARLIAGAGAGEVVDHINGDTLDNRRANLRVCSPDENARNRRKNAGKVSSRFKGVSRRNSKWLAAINFEGRQFKLGLFETEELAAQAYDAAAKKYHGEFARLNFPTLDTANVPTSPRWRMRSGAAANDDRPDPQEWR